jgi:porin
LKVGLYDLNSEFDVLESSGLFVGSAHGIGTDIAQSGEAGPSIFPTTSLAARIEVEPANNLKIRAAILDGVPGNPDRPKRTAINLGNGDGALLIAEAEASIESAKILFGHWRYTSDFETWSGDIRDGNDGWYVRGEARLLSEREDGAQGLDGFARYGIAEGRFNPFDTFLSGGLTYTGLFPNHDDDQIGVAIATAFTSKQFRQFGPSLKHETALELTYRKKVNDWLTVQPGLHYVMNPSATPGTPDAVALMLRMEVSFGELFR